MTTDRATARCADDDDSGGSPLDQVRALLASGDADEVIALFANLLADNGALQRQLAELSRKRFKTSEAVSSAQLRLLLMELGQGGEAASPGERAEADEELAATADLDALKDADGDAKKKSKKKKAKQAARRPFPDKLRRVVNLLSVPAGERSCPKCGGARECIGHDVTETLDRVPAEIIVVQNKQEKLACKNAGCEGTVCRAPGPDKVVTGGRLGPRLVAGIMVDKYRDGLPLHRQIQRFRRLGVDIPLSTLVDQVRHVGDSAKVLQRAATEEVLAAHVMHLDGTGLPVLDRARRNGTRYGSLWGYIGGDVTLFLYASTGKKQGQREDDDGRLIEMGPEDVLRRRKGLVVADASNLFDKSFERDDLIECGCNAHSRRRFVKAVDQGDPRAALVVGAYRRLYEFEREAKELSVDARTEIRQKKSKPVFDAILKWCQAYKPHEPPSSPLGQAISYFINHNAALGRFLEDGAIPIDNNIIERQHVRVALTRKNFLFVGSDAGGDRAAVLYTLLGCCALVDVDPEEYLADVLPRLAGGGISIEQARALLPHRWKLRRAAT
jgi:transposase